MRRCWPKPPPTPLPTPAPVIRPRAGNPNQRRRGALWGEDRCRLRNQNAGCALGLVDTALLRPLLHCGWGRTRQVFERNAARPDQRLEMLAKRSFLLENLKALVNTPMNHHRTGHPLKTRGPHPYQSDLRLPRCALEYGVFA